MVAEASMMRFVINYLVVQGEIRKVSLEDANVRENFNLS